MSSPTTLFNAFRSAVTAMQDHFSDASGLALECSLQGWTATVFDDVILNSGDMMSATDFMDAIGCVLNLQSNFATEATTLVKMRP